MRLRRSQLTEVLNQTLRYGLDVPVIVAGDFNFDVTKTGNAYVKEVGFHNPFGGSRTAYSASPFVRPKQYD